MFKTTLEFRMEKGHYIDDNPIKLDNSLFRILSSLIGESVSLFIMVGAFRLVMADKSLLSFEGIPGYILILIATLNLLSFMMHLYGLNKWFRVHTKSGLSVKEGVIEEAKSRKEDKLLNASLIITMAYSSIILLGCIFPVWTGFIPFYLGAPLLAVGGLATILWLIVLKLHVDVRSDARAV